MSLTQKQINFANDIFDGMPNSKAYKKNYDAENMNDNTVSRRAYELVNHPKVVQYLKEKNGVVTASQAWNLNRIIEESHELLQLAKQNDDISNSIKAVNMIGEYLGLKIEKKAVITADISAKRDPEAIERMKKALLEQAK